MKNEEYAQPLKKNIFQIIVAFFYAMQFPFKQSKPFQFHYLLN